MNLPYGYLGNIVFDFLDSDGIAFGGLDSFSVKMEIWTSFEDAAPIITRDSAVDPSSKISKTSTKVTVLLLSADWDLLEAGVSYVAQFRFQNGTTIYRSRPFSIDVQKGGSF